MEISKRSKDIRKQKKLWKEITLKEECLTTLETQDKGDVWCVDSDWSKHMIRDEDKFLKKQKVPHENSWRRKEDSKDIEEMKIQNIKEVSQDDEDFNNVVVENDVHHDGKQDEYIEEEVSDCGRTEFECLF